MIGLTSQGDRVRIDMDFADFGSEALFSVETAENAAAALRQYAGQAAVAAPGQGDREPTITVDAVVSGRRPMVRWKFSWRSGRYFLSAAQAILLADATATAARKAAENLRWIEERDPLIMMR